jgi:hypothetical protein
MTRITLDSALRDRLGNITEQIELCNESGETLGYFIPGPGRSRQGGGQFEPPYTAEEIAASRKVRTGRTLDEILKDVGLR